MQLFSRDKIILDLCGGSGRWSKPYADAGYNVRVITWPDDVRLLRNPRTEYMVFWRRLHAHTLPALEVVGGWKKTKTEEPLMVFRLWMLDYE